MRTGSIGNRDTETLIGTLVEPKRSVLLNLRRELLAQGYAEEAGYDPINIESFVSFSLAGVTRFIFKHKWELAVLFVFSSIEEKAKLFSKCPEIQRKRIETNDEDGTMWISLDPENERDLIKKIAKVCSS